MPLLWCAASFLFGIILDQLLHLPWLAWGCAAAISFIVLLLDRKLHIRFSQVLQKHISCSPFIILLLLTIGGLRSALNTPVFRVDDIAAHNDQGEWVVTAWVSAAPDRRDDGVVYQMTSIELIDPRLEDWMGSLQKVEGKVMVKMGLETDWQYGDLLQFTAELKTPSASSDFSYRDYLAIHHVYSVVYFPQRVQKVGEDYGSRLREGLIRLRERARETIFQLFPQPESGLLTGILLGMDNYLPETLKEDYRTTGVAHIIAISGFNMAVLAVLLLWVFTRWFSPYWGAFLTVAVLLVYTAFVQGSAAVTRAWIMAGVAAGGHLIGRRQAGVNSLFFTAAVMCMVNPLLIQDVSFQLSFAATFGLITFAAPLQEGFKAFLEGRFSEQTASRFATPISQYFLFTLAAQVATLPVLVWHFGRVSISALLANPLVLPVQSPILVLGGLATIIGMIALPLGKVIAILTWPFIKYTNWIVTLLAGVKGGSMAVHPGAAIWILVGFLIILAVFLTRNYFKKYLGSTLWVWLMVGLAFSSITVWLIYLHRPDGRLHLHLVRCGEEATLFVQTPQGNTMMIDPRGDVDQLSAGFQSSLSPWNFDLDAVLLTERGSANQVTGLSDQIEVKQTWLAPRVYRPSGSEAAILLSDDLEIVKLTSGQTVEVEKGVTFSLVAETSIATAVLISFGGQQILIPNGVDFAVIRAEAPNALENLTALVLQPEDVSYIPPRVWLQLKPGVILWNSATLSPFDDSYGADEVNHVMLTMDGETAWVQEQ
jgi:competence protein ComEC